MLQKKSKMQLSEAMQLIEKLQLENVYLKNENEKLTKETNEFLEELEKTVVEIEKLDWWGKITKYGKLIWDMYLVVKKRIDAKKK
jgi:hypothetical protein